MKFFVFVFITLALVQSCSKSDNSNKSNKSKDDQSSIPLELKSAKLNLVFSHNINGETHPCGCRHHPLGGLAQVAGALSKLSQESDVLYVDTGDTFFPSNNIPPSLKQSFLFTAKTIKKVLTDFGLKLYVPGDQDFSAGWDWLSEHSHNSEFQFLIANLKPKLKKEKNKVFRAKPWIKFTKGDHRLYFTGLLFSKLLNPKHRDFFMDNDKALKKVLSELKQDGYNPKNPKHRLILLSHSGMDEDQRLAKSFPELDWIIGAHSQNFTRESYDVGQTKIVQVLSRNHYLGKIQIALNQNEDKKNDTFSLIEIRDNQKDHLKTNKWISFIQDYKKELDQIQANEQSKMDSFAHSKIKYQSYISCIDCHQAQVNQWKSTPHSLAFTTLLKANESNNPSCIGCHSLGYKDEKGFIQSSARVVFEKGSKKTYESYLKDFNKQFAKTKLFSRSLRELSSKEVLDFKNQELAFDQKQAVFQNYSHVQCLNCHTKHLEHPFGMDEVHLQGSKRYEAIKNKCLNCHTNDQSTHWYKKDEKGNFSSKLDEKVFQKMYKKVACPLEKKDQDNQDN